MSWVYSSLYFSANSNGEAEIVSVILRAKASIKRLKKENKFIYWEVILSEGKNREIRKICSYFGWEVNKLIRIKYGDFHIGNLRSGQIKEIINHNYNDKNYWR